MKREEYHNLKRKKKKKRLRPWVSVVFSTIFLSMIIFSSFELYKWAVDNKNIKKLTKEIQDDYVVTEIEEQGELINPPEEEESDYWYYVKMPFYDVNFDTLLQKNADTVAFIHLPSTNINYPVVQSSDNEYYLNHAYDHSNNGAGWVYMDYRNSLNPMNDNTIIYGHGRLDNTVFGSLKQTLTSSWQQNKENYTVWLSTPYENMVFQIFSIYTMQSESYYITTSFNSTKAKQDWINTMKSRNTAPIDVPVSVDDYFLTLSTCLNNDGGRIVVQAKLIKKQPK